MGTTSTVGIAGLTLGREHGLTMDQLESVEWYWQTLH